MGTSVNQSSPRETNWNRVFTCYSDKNIPEDRVVNEIWRASENQKTPLSSDIKSESTFLCYQNVKRSKRFEEALLRINKSVVESGTNSIVNEFARRAVPSAYRGKSPADDWRSLFFSELTNYVISRDASGFVGPHFRNRSVTDLIKFKKGISERVREIVASIKVDPRSPFEWGSFVDNVIKRLKGQVP